MACRLAIAFAVVLATSPVLGQEFGQELELGGGWYQTNPFDVIYDLSGPAGPSVNFAWTRWRNERTGITVGVTTVLSHEGTTSQVGPSSPTGTSHGGDVGSGATGTALSTSAWASGRRLLGRRTPTARPG